MKTNTFAAIDIGSNAIRLLINQIHQFETHTNFNKTSLVRIPIRLGQEVFHDGNISEETLERLLKGMKAYTLLMEVYNVEKYKAFATSAMREANNSEEIVSKVSQSCGIDIEIISGEKEAQILFLTELSKFTESVKPYLYIDVGGGSTEITLLKKGKVLASKSFQVGTVRMLSGKTDSSFLQEHIKPWIEKHVKHYHADAIGSGGNINYIFKLSGKKEGYPIRTDLIKKYYNTMKNMTYEERIEFYNMKLDRADVIIPALEIYTKILKWADIDKIYIPKIGVSDGMIQYMYHHEKH